MHANWFAYVYTQKLGITMLLPCACCYISNGSHNVSGATASIVTTTLSVLAAIPNQQQLQTAPKVTAEEDRATAAAEAELECVCIA